MHDLDRNTGGESNGVDENRRRGAVQRRELGLGALALGLALASIACTDVDSARADVAELDSAPYATSADVVELDSAQQASPGLFAFAGGSLQKRTGFGPDTGWSAVGGLRGFTTMVAFHGSVYGAWSNRLYRWDGGEQWTDVAEALGAVALAVHRGELFMVDRTTLWRRGDLTTATAWLPAGVAHGVIGMASYQGHLYAVADNKLWQRGAIGPNSGNDWVQVGQAWNVTGMTDFEGQMYVVSDDNLYRRGTIASGFENDWIYVGEAVGVTAMAGLAADPGSLRALTATVQEERSTFGAGTTWSWEDENWGFRMQVAFRGRLYGVVRDDWVLERDHRGQWFSLYQAPGAIALAVHHDQIYMIAGNRILRRSDFAAATPWIDLGSADGVTRLASYQGRLYGTTSTELKVLGFNPGQQTAWGPAGDAYGVTALATYQGRLYAASGDKLWVRGVIGPNSGNDWSYAGDAIGVIAMTTLPPNIEPN